MRFAKGFQELAPEYIGQGVHRKQEIGLAVGSMPLAVRFQHPPSHRRMDMDVQPQVLRPSVQHRAKVGVPPPNPIQRGLAANSDSVWAAVLN